MDRNIKIILRYDGTRYDGWQKQGNTEQTVQGKLEAVLEKMAGQPVEVHGSGRTDAGVHALAQTANFHLPESFFRTFGQPQNENRRRQAVRTEQEQTPETARNCEQTPEADQNYAPSPKADQNYAPSPEAGGNHDRVIKEILNYLNRFLPEDIAVLEIEEAPPRFHSRLNAVSKTYQYRIETAAKKDVFERKYIYGLGSPLDVDAMQKAAKLLEGTHDFKGYCSLKKMKKSTVRTLEQLAVKTEGTRVFLDFTGNGFLYNMVRILTGTLIEVGLHTRTAESVREALESGDRALAGKTAPAEGLFLLEVSYRT